MFMFNLCDQFNTRIDIGYPKTQFSGTREPSLEGDRLEVAHIWEFFSEPGRRFTIVAWGRVPGNIEVCLRLEKKKNLTTIIFLYY